MKSRGVDEVLELLARKGNAAYFGEHVSILEHSLQAAHFAETAGAAKQVISAALLHDIGHLLHGEGEDVADHGKDSRHEELACGYLAQWFDESVIAPIRMHVEAKRYLCAVEPDYHAQLSESSEKSLRLQGGIMTALEVAEFLKSPYADTAIRLRRWDDEAKVEELTVPGLRHYRQCLVEASGAAQRSVEHH